MRPNRPTHVAVNVAPVDGVGTHVGVEIPDADSIVAGAGHERASGQNALHAFFGRRVRLDAPDARSVIQKRMRFANLSYKIETRIIIRLSRQNRGKRGTEGNGL